MAAPHCGIWLKLLLKKGANPDQADVHGNVLLWTAVQNYEDDRLILLLLRAGADPRIKNKYGRSPYTVLKKDDEAIGKLIAKRFKGAR